MMKLKTKKYMLCFSFPLPLIVYFLMNLVFRCHFGKWKVFVRSHWIKVRWIFWFFFSYLMFRKSNSYFFLLIFDNKNQQELLIVKLVWRFLRKTLTFFQKPLILPYSVCQHFDFDEILNPDLMHFFR